jgi:hypothetical protein
MIFYEPRENGRWVEKRITIDSLEQLEKLVIISILTGGCLEVETREEAEMLSKLLPDLEPFRREVMIALDVFKTASELLSKLV